MQPVSTAQTSLPQGRVASSGIAVSQAPRSQPQQLVHVSNVQMQQAQHQNNQVVPMSPVSHSQSPQMLAVVSSVPSSLMPNSSVQMLAPSSVAVSQTVTSMSSSQIPTAVTMSQGMSAPTNIIVNQSSNLQNNKFHYYVYRCRYVSQLRQVKR